MATEPPRRRRKEEDPPPLTRSGIGNPYAENLMTLFSQSSVSNAGTRGLDDFSKWLYVDTRIDKVLKDRIIEGGPSLILITGNAGDGKTAFIRNVEMRLRLLTEASHEPARGGNGSIIRTRDHEWRTNWDGSQDEAGVDNGEVLADFFRPFSGDALSPTPGKTSVIAINEGRLVDFLDSNRSEFRALEATVHELFAGEDAHAPGMASSGKSGPAESSLPTV